MRICAIHLQVTIQKTLYEYCLESQISEHSTHDTHLVSPPAGKTINTYKPEMASGFSCHMMPVAQQRVLS